MTSKWSIVTIGLAGLLFTAGPAWACLAVTTQAHAPMDPGIEGSDIGSGGSAVVFEVDGYIALGSEPGDTCGVAPTLPEGLAPTTISIVHAKTGEPVGFGQFRADARARRGFCGQGSRNCVAFISRVTQQGVKAGTPLKMIIEAESEVKIGLRQVAKLAVRVARSSVIVAGGVDKNGFPYRHLSVFRPSGIKVVMPR